MGTKTPILLITFNRADTTQRVFDAIRAVEPNRLFVFADGPRENRPDDQSKCKATRDVVRQVNWQCEVKMLFQDKNLGCGPGPLTAPVVAINWFLENVEEGIILEDDCLASTDFFRFCEELLDRYRDNERIMEITGDNFQYGRKRGKASYYFSTWTHNWGWATWRRAWKHYGYELTPTELAEAVWDHQWMISVAKRNGLTVVPNVNLVSNIGFSPDGTHNLGLESAHIPKFLNLPTERMVFPLIHPVEISPDKAADRHDFYYRYCVDTYMTGAVWRGILIMLGTFLPPKAKRAIRAVLARKWFRPLRKYILVSYRISPQG